MSKEVSCLQGGCFGGYDPMILYNQNPFRKNLELLGETKYIQHTPGV